MERSKVWEAAQKHKDGYNCCQAVVCTYCERLGMDEKTAFRAAEAYGLGIAGMFQTCGSVCGMMMLAGLKTLMQTWKAQLPNLQPLIWEKKWQNALNRETPA